MILRPMGRGAPRITALWLILVGALWSGPVARAQEPAGDVGDRSADAAEEHGTSAQASDPDSEPVTPEAAASPAVSGAEEGAASTSTAKTTSPNAARTASAEMSAGTYAVRLRDLEQRINELKEQIFRSKARLSLLAETVLQGVVAGSRAIIMHENRMSSSYRLVRATYALDGAPIFNKADEEGALADQQQFEIFHGSIVPGEHTLTVNLEYQGHGFGIFSYLKGYRFKVSSNHTFTAPEGKGVKLRVVAYEKGGPTAPLEDRPAIRFVERVTEVGDAKQQRGGGRGGQ